MWAFLAVQKNLQRAIFSSWIFFSQVSIESSSLEIPYKRLFKITQLKILDCYSIIAQ